MNITKTSNTNLNFKGWHESSKTAVVGIIKRLPKAKQQKAISLVNELETASPHHNLNANSMGFWVVPKDKFTKTRDFNFMVDPMGLFWISPVKCLEKMSAHIRKENSLIAEVGKTVETLIPKLKKFDANCGIFSTGLKLDRKARKLFAVELAKLSIDGVGDKGRQMREQALQLLDTINQKAHNTNMRILSMRSDKAILIKGENLRGSYSHTFINIKDDFIKTLKNVEKFLDKENIKNKQYKAKCGIKNAKEELRDARLELKGRKREIRSQQIEVLKEKLFDNPVGRFFNQIFEKIEKKSQAKENKIAKQLNF